MRNGVICIVFKSTPEDLLIKFIKMSKMAQFFVTIWEKILRFQRFYLEDIFLSENAMKV